MHQTFDVSKNSHRSSVRVGERNATIVTLALRIQIHIRIGLAHSPPDDDDDDDEVESGVLLVGSQVVACFRKC